MTSCCKKIQNFTDGAEGAQSEDDIVYLNLKIKLLKKSLLQRRQICRPPRTHLKTSITPNLRRVLPSPIDVVRNQPRYCFPPMAQRSRVAVYIEGDKLCHAPRTKNKAEYVGGAMLKRLGGPKNLPLTLSSTLIISRFLSINIVLIFRAFDATSVTLPTY